MIHSIGNPPLLHLIAHKPFWAVFSPDEPSASAEKPALEVQAAWLADFLNLWSWHVYAFLFDDETSSQNKLEKTPATGRDESLHLLLKSLRHATDVLLAFQRHDYSVPLPDRFLKSANLLLNRAERSQAQRDDLTVAQMARRLSAATSHLVPGPREVKIDDNGRVFSQTGERLLQFEPETVLNAQQSVNSGRSLSLAEIREAETRDAH